MPFEYGKGSQAPAGGWFVEDRFREQVDSALVVVKNILDTTRSPRHASDEDHEYDDKYGLAEFLANAAIAAYMNVLEGLGIDGATLKELRKIVSEQKRSVTLRFEAEETCEFVKEQVVDVEGKHQFVTETEESKKKGGSASKETTTTTTHKVVTKVTEYHWRVGLQYVVYAYAGSDPQIHAAILQRRSSFADVVTTGSKKSPFPAKVRSTPVNVPLTWLLENISPDDLTCQFTIDRSKETCRTPRRNEDVEGALGFFAGMKSWGEKVRDCLVRDVEGKIILGTHTRDGEPPSVGSEAKVHLHSVDDEGVFVPVLPLFENRDAAGDGDELAQSSPLLSVSDINLFLAEQRRSLDEKVTKLREFFPSKDGDAMISAAEAIIVLLSLHMEKIVDHFADGVDYIENMLKTQLIKAIGKEVQASDFAEFVRFHDRKLLKDKYAPEPFSYAVRIPNHCPNGALSIESDQPITSITRKLDGGSRPMFLPINAATSVELAGDLFLHAWVSHCFAGQPEASHALVARARQFSSFLLLVGKISGPDAFEAQDAIILQNKDEVLIPLLLNQLPTPKEFKDAISSLSPEQKRFATAFRNMQLESSVFAVCCIQLKPQLEALLGLPGDSLTKEIKLTEDLLSLFIDYQIPSDLLSFDGATEMSVSEKVGNVKGHVGSVLKVIEDAKDRDLEAAQKEADMASELKQGQYLFGAPAEPKKGQNLFGSPAPASGLFGSPAPAPSPFAASSPFGSLPGAACAAAPSGTPFGGGRFGGPPAPAAPGVPPPPAGGGGIFGNTEVVVRPACGLADFAPESAEACSERTAEKATVPVVGGDVTPSTFENAELLDFTRIPKMLDTKFEELDKENAICATVIKTGEAWTKKFQRNLLTKPEEKAMSRPEQRSERDKAFDLLDALSRSGSLRVECAELHVVIAATHNFDRSLMETVIQENVNPIEKMEKSTLIVASAIHGVSAEELLKDDMQVSRVKKYSPGLFG